MGEQLYRRKTDSTGLRQIIHLLILVALALVICGIWTLNDAPLRIAVGESLVAAGVALIGEEREWL